MSYQPAVPSVGGSDDSAADSEVLDSPNDVVGSAGTGRADDALDTDTDDGAAAGTLDDAAGGLADAAERLDAAVLEPAAALLAVLLVSAGPVAAHPARTTASAPAHMAVQILVMTL